MRSAASPPPPWSAPALVFAVTAAAFLPGIFGEFVLWDDDQNFLELTHYRGLGPRQLRWMFSAFHMGHYTPLTWLTLGLDHVVWGMNPLGYHLTSLALHAATAVAFFHLARRLLWASFAGRVGPAALVVGATGAALMFAVHPLRVESVVWLSERRDVLSGLLYVLTVLAYLKSLDGRAAGGVPPERGAVWYWASVGLFLCAILAKALVVTLPLALIVLDVYPLRRLGGAVGWTGPAAKRVWAEKIPFLLLGAAGGVVAFLARAPLETASSLQTFDLIARLAVSVYGLAFYLRKTVWPVGLSPLYEMPAFLVLLSPSLVLSLVGILLLGSLAVGARRVWPALPAALATYLATVIPVIGFFQSGPQITADRYSYLACLGWAVLGGGGAALCAEGWRRPSTRRWWHGAVLVAATLVAVVSVGLTARQSLVWRDSFSVWARVLEVDPDSPRGHTGMARALFAEGNVEEAGRYFRRALELSPSVPEALIGRAITLGVLGNTAEAVRYARAAARRRPHDPEINRLLGSILGFDRRPAEALSAFREAARLDPRSALYRYSIAAALAELGRLEEVRGVLAEADRLAQVVSPDDADNDRQAAIVLSRLDDREGARLRWKSYLARTEGSTNPSRIHQARRLEALRDLQRLGEEASPAALPPSALSGSRRP